MRLNSQALQIGSDFAPDGHVKLYFLEGGTRAIVDTGVETSPERDIALYLAYYGYKLDDTDIILNTHGHLDHADGNPFIPRAEVWIHEEDAFFVEDAGKKFDVFLRPSLRLRSESQIEAGRAKFTAGFRKQKVGRRLKDGDVVELGKGIQLRVVHLPGHTLGSVGYLWEKEGILFSGDGAVGQGSRPGSLPFIFHPFAYARTLDKLLHMPIGTLATAHHYESLRCAAMPIRKGEQVSVFLEDCREILERILESVGKAVHRHWQAPLPTVLGEAVDDLSTRLYLRREPSTGLPANALHTLGACYDGIMGIL